MAGVGLTGGAAVGAGLTGGAAAGVGMVAVGVEPGTTRALQVIRVARPQYKHL